MEQTLGHVTHSQNLATAVARQERVLATWIPIPFATSGIERLVPAYATNWSFRASFRARRQLAAALAARPHGALFFHTQVTALFSLGLIRRVPSVISLDATPLNFDSVGAAYGHRPASGGWIDEQKHRLNHDAFAAASALVTWSEWTKASLVTDYGVDHEKVTVLAPGAARPFFALGALRTRHPSAEKPVRLLFVGGDFERKGGPILLEAAATIRTDRPFELHIVTPARVSARPGVFIHREARPNTPELHQLFREADAFVLPSLGECLSVVLMEAAAAALPIVSTAVGALPEAAQHATNALIVPAGDVRALRGALEAIVDDPTLRVRLGVASRALALAKFDADRNNERLIGIIADVASAQRSWRAA